MLMAEEYDSYAAQAEGHADGANQQQRLAAELVDERHAHQRRQQVHRTHRDRLQIARDLVESRHGENVIQVIQDGVDSGELVEGRDGDGEIDRKPVFALEERLGVRRVFHMHMHGGNDLVEFVLGIVGPQYLRWKSGSERGASSTCTCTEATISSSSS